MILNLVDKTDPILLQTAEKFDFYEPPTDPIQLAKDLTETMLSKNGLGLAAPQVGLPYRVFVMKANPILCCYNPMIVSSEGEVTLEEGCLTFLNLYVKVTRPQRIRVRYTYPNGEVVTNIFEGMTARVFQHELDHLNGILYTSRATLFHREQAERKAKKANKTAK